MTRFNATLLTAAVLVAFATPATGQTSFGVKLGANFASMAGDDVTSEFGSRTGLVLGGLARYQVTDLFSVQPELLYSQKGASFSETFLGETIEGDIRLDYLEVPLLLVVNVPVGAPELRPTIHVGPTFAFELNCTISYSGFGESGTEDCGDDDDRRKLDVGLGLGGGLDIGFGAGVLMIEARYTMGLQTLDTGNNPDDVKNRAWSVTFGYRFR
jgi:hypothetical protein